MDLNLSLPPKLKILKGKTLKVLLPPACALAVVSVYVSSAIAGPPEGARDITCQMGNSDSSITGCDNAIAKYKRELHQLKSIRDQKQDPMDGIRYENMRSKLAAKLADSYAVRRALTGTGAGEHERGPQKYFWPSANGNSNEKSMIVPPSKLSSLANWAGEIAIGPPRHAMIC